jgi:hypothetical protein
VFETEVEWEDKWRVCLIVSLIVFSLLIVAILVFALCMQKTIPEREKDLVKQTS